MQKIKVFIQRFNDIPHIWEDLGILLGKIGEIERRLDRIEKMFSCWSEDDGK